MQITIDQIRAARSLVNWTQQDLANAAGVVRDTVKNIENGKTPHQDTLSKVVNALERANVEFTENEGVRKRNTGVMTYQGKEGFAEFRKDVLEEARKGEPDICVSNVDERLFDQWGEGEVNDHYRSTMRALMANDASIKRRILIKEGDDHTTATDNAEYRWIPEKEFGDFPFYIYGDKTAMILFEDDKLDVFIISHPLITHYFRKQFDDKWDAGQVIT
jgi:transcriptional regulator with XRE-family HTH domain